MQYQALNQQRCQPVATGQLSATEKVLSVCPAGLLETTVAVPPTVSNRRPLLALHGISRNADEVVAAFSEAAVAAGRIVIVPHFSAENWPVYQRFTRRARPDKALLALFATLRVMDATFNGPFDVFGFSGGAQLAHRFTMLYPESVGELHLGAAGWYTLPDETMAYPYGVNDTQEGSQSWSRLMRAGLPRFLEREITVYVGERDTTREESLRTNPELDSHQGIHRRARAEHYVRTIVKRQVELGISQRASLQLLPGCDHSFRTCAEHAGLARRVCGAL